MKRFTSLSCLLICLHIAAIAQCSSEILPSPKRFGDPKYWPYGFRPSTECELNFFRKFHSTMYQAVIGILQDNYHTVGVTDKNKGEDDDIKQLDDEGLFYNFALSVRQGSEKGYYTWISGKDLFEGHFSTGSEDNQKRLAELTVDYINNVTRMDGDKVIQATNTDPALIANSLEQNKINGETFFDIYVPNVNVEKDELTIRNGKIELVSVNGATYAVRIIRDKKIANIDNDRDVSHDDETRLYIGKWKAPQITSVNGVQKLQIQQNFDRSQPKLSLQNMAIVITCAPGLADDAIQHIRFDKLNALMPP